MSRIFLLLLFQIVLSANAQTHSTNYYDVLKSCECHYPVQTKTYYSSEGFCDRTFYLNSDSTFTEQGGCESHNFLLFGSWKISGDSIELNSKPKGMANVICQVEYFNEFYPENKTEFLITDKTGKAVNDFVIFPMINSQKYVFWKDWTLSQDEKDTAIYTDSAGIALIDCSKFDSLDLRVLSLLSGRNIRFGTKNIHGQINIVLNFNFEYGLLHIGNMELQCSGYKKPIRFKMTRDQLIKGDWILKLKE